MGLVLIQPEGVIVLYNTRGPEALPSCKAVPSMVTKLHKGQVLVHTLEAIPQKEPVANQDQLQLSRLLLDTLVTNLSHQRPGQH